MKLLEIPGLNGKKTAIAGWGLLLIGVANLILAIGNCLMSGIDVLFCMQTVQETFTPVVTALGGLGILGVGHKLQKATEAGSGS